MSDTKTFHLVLNIIGALLGFIVVGYVVYAYFQTATEPPCSGRYPAPIRFGLQANDGKPLTSMQLQARVGSRERGVLENLSVVRAGEVPTGEALEVKLKPAVSGEKGHSPLSGVKFEWLPPGIGGAKTACLAYSVWLPGEFDFADGGVLPGLFGQPLAPLAGSKPGFAALIGWTATGSVELAHPAADGGYRTLRSRNFRLAAGRWIRLEQEIVLNTPGEADGLVRMWADGEFIAEQGERTIRADDKVGISGVMAEIAYRFPAAKPGTLRLSPLEMAWR